MKCQIQLDFTLSNVYLEVVEVEITVAVTLVIKVVILHFLR